MNIYLMRHGETDWNKARRLQGTSDVPLNAYGIELAEKTAEGLKDVDFDAAFSSPLVRAYETARIVIGSRQVEIVRDERLREMYFGPSEGRHFDEERNNPQNPLYLLMQKPECYAPTDGSESIGQVRERGQAFLRDKIVPLEGSCENVLIVAHGAFNRCVLNPLAGVADSEFWKIALPNCAVSVLSLQNGKFRVVEQSRIYYDMPVNGRP